MQRGGGLDAFEQIVAPVEQVQSEWHAYVRRLKAALAGSDLQFFKSRKPPGSINASPKPESWAGGFSVASPLPSP